MKLDYAEFIECEEKRLSLPYNDYKVFLPASPSLTSLPAKYHHQKLMPKHLYLHSPGYIRWWMNRPGLTRYQLAFPGDCD
jgi:hypothetical protein